MGPARTLVPTSAVLALVFAALLATSFASVKYAAANKLKRTHLPGISDQDQRWPLLNPVAPWTAVGRVNRGTGGYCSGTLIAPDKVLTAAHCLWNKRTNRWLRADALHFLAGYFRGAYIAYGKVRKLQLAFGVSMDGQGRPIDLAMDWAILILTAPMRGGAILRPISLARAADLIVLQTGTPLPQAGYSRDRAHMLTVVDRCHFLGWRKTRGGALLLHDCDATFGDSGSPVLMNIDGDLKIVGIHVATWRKDGKDRGLAVRLPDALLKPNDGR